MLFTGAKNRDNMDLIPNFPDSPAGAAVVANSNMKYADEKNFIVKDDNAATHLLRNALGGANEDLLCGLLGGTNPPNTRRLRYATLAGFF